MKILHLYRDLWVDGGIPYQTRCLIEGQIKTGSLLVSFAQKGNSLETWPHLLHPNHSSVVTSGLNSLFQLREILRAHKPDIVHITGLWIPIHQLWAIEVSRAKVPYVVSTHGNLSPHGMEVRFGEKKQVFSRILAKKFWHRFFDLPLLQNAAGIQVHSPYEMDLVKSAGLQNIFIVPNGIQSEWVGSYDDQPRKLHNPITFLHLGRLDIYHKGLDLICQALKGLVQSGHSQQVKVILAGPGVKDSRDVLKRWAKQIGNGILEIRDGVWGKDKDNIWRETDYFLNLYRYAGMAIAPSEAVAKGIPLIASREGHFGDWAADSGFGIQVPLDGEKLLKTMAALLNLSESDYQDLSKNALRFAKTYTWDKVANDVVHAYQRLLDLGRFKELG
ncbi:MAG: glycosyltransferase [Nitrospira sp.]|nr:glycosyltransferase [Nitrospira sp.]